MTKEEAYDKKIAPLMTKIIAVCEKHKIAHLCHFELDGEGEDQVLCTSCNTSPDRNPSDAIKGAVKVVYPPPAQMIAFAITVKDGT